MATGVSYYGRINTNVISHYFFNDVWENITNFRPLFKKLKDKAHIETGLDGQDLTWNVHAGRHALSNYSEGQSITIARKKHEIQARLPWSYYYIDDAITRDEISMASGPSAIYKLNKDLLERMKRNFNSRLGYEVFNQNGTTAAGNVVHGFPTIFQPAATGTDENPIDSTGTYAGLSLAAGGITSIDNADSGAWSPTILFATSTGFATGGATWALNCTAALTALKDRLTKGSEADQQPDLVIHDRSRFSAFKNKLTESQRLIVNGVPEGTQGGGIPGAIVWDGLDHTFDVDAIASTSVMLNTSQIWMDVLKVPDVSGMPGIPGGGSAGKDDMFEVLTQNDINGNAILVRVNLRWQLRMNPKYQGKLV